MYVNSTISVAMLLMSAGRGGGGAVKSLSKDVTAPCPSSTSLSTHFIALQPRCSPCCSSETYTSISSIVISNCSNQPESHAGRQTACQMEPEAEEREEKYRKISILLSPSVITLYILNRDEGRKKTLCFLFQLSHCVLKDLPFWLQR